ncbi:hypothetical protein LPJ56_001386 [Coemansia sp. RSA 2599]|nr:hypothetical protein LPJ75_000983 [Coemansia sp. RSA 2598]KAJ1827937.1 hypothetical protein LPJ56_001386 [Coemansia sp. RSA 2599]
MPMQQTLPRVIAAALLPRLARSPAVQRRALHVSRALLVPLSLQTRGCSRSAAILGALRYKSTDTKASVSVQPATSSASTAAADPQQARMLIGFTCKVCSHRQHKTMSKQAYTKGVVLIQCDSCKNRHLIADHLGWFRDSSVTIQDIMREKGESIRHLEDIGLLDNIEAEKIQQTLDAESHPDNNKQGK